MMLWIWLKNVFLVIILLTQRKKGEISRQDFHAAVVENSFA
jgi:hypothetical protein